MISLREKWPTSHIIGCLQFLKYIQPRSMSAKIRVEYDKPHQ